MEFKEALNKLENSKEFEEWKKKNTDSYLAHGFIMQGRGEGEWQIGYYNRKKELMTSFFIDEKIKISPETEVFKRDGHIVKELDAEKVRFDYSEAMSYADKFRKENYRNEEPMYIIVILQNLNIGQVWNITFVTKNFNALNMKISPENGKILDNSLTPLMEFGKRM